MDRGERTARRVVGQSGGRREPATPLAAAQSSADTTSRETLPGDASAPFQMVRRRCGRSGSMAR